MGFLPDVARLASYPKARGAWVPTWDDGYMDAWTPIEALARNLGQRVTWCIQTNRIDQTNGPPSATILEWYNHGHEIASHSVTHPNIANIATGLRPAEYDDSKTAIEAIIGAGNCRTWVYPSGSLGSPVARSTGTDRELYLRYDRLLDTAVGGLHPLTERAPYLVARMSWDQTTHAQVLQLIRLCAKKDVILATYSHNFTLGPTWVQVQEAMNLAASLGVPCLTAAEAFPRNGYLVNAGFEDGLDGWELINSQSPATTNICEVVTDTPATNLQGTKSLHLVLGDTGAVGVKQLIPVLPGRQYKFGCTARSANGTVPGGGAIHAYMRVMELDYAALETGTVQANSGEITSTTWAATALTYTAAVTDRMVAAQVRVMGQAGLEIYVDHVWFSETKYGVNVW